MPPGEIIARGNPATFEGDFKSHLFQIDHMRDFPVAMEGGRRVNPGYLSVDYACMRCHQVYEDRRWAVRYSLYVHDIKVTTNVKIMQFQRIFTFIGFFFAIIALFSAFSLKNWLWSALNKQKMTNLHKQSAWITFFVYLFMTTMCLYFHFPVKDPSRILGFGWFFIHFVNGTLGIFLYTGKITSVRIFKKVWQRQGIMWGLALFLFWIIQMATVLL